MQTFSVIRPRECVSACGFICVFERKPHYHRLFQNTAVAIKKFFRKFAIERMAEKEMEEANNTAGHNSVFLMNVRKGEGK